MNNLLNWTLKEKNILPYNPIPIVRNLLDNAVKYTPSGGKIEISAIKLHQKILLEVSDTGIGIAPHKLKTIFELKKNKSTKGTHGEIGSGLGLNLVRDLVLLNKGKISVNSEEQRGTTFKIFLPAA